MPLQRDQPRAREKPRTALSACQKVIVKNRKSRASQFLQLLLIGRLFELEHKWIGALAQATHQGAQCLALIHEFRVFAGSPTQETADHGVVLEDGPKNNDIHCLRGSLVDSNNSASRA